MAYFYGGVAKETEQQQQQTHETGNTKLKQHATNELSSELLARAAEFIVRKRYYIRDDNNKSKMIKLPFLSIYQQKNTAKINNNNNNSNNTDFKL